VRGKEPGLGRKTEKGGHIMGKGKISATQLISGKIKRKK